MSDHVDYDPFAGGELALSHETTEAQKELWLAAQLGHDANCSYNLTVRLDFQVPIDAERLQSALERTAVRNSSLRMTFSKDGAYFHIAAEPAINMEVIDAGADLTATIKRVIEAEADTPFDLASGPLWRCKLVTSGEQSTVFLTTHHIVADGWSTGLILEDMAAGYAATAVDSDAAPSQFEDYARWLDADEVQAQADKDLEYWQGRFVDHAASPSIPSHRERQSTHDFQCHFLSYALTPECLAQAQEYGKAHRVTQTNLLTTAFATYLSCLSGTQRVVLGIPTAGQLDAGMTDLVGHCVNTLPFLATIDASTSFTENLARNKSTLLDDFEHRKVTFGTLLKSTGDLREQLDGPLVPIVFNVEPAEFELSFDESRPRVLFLPRKYDNFDASFNCAVTKSGLTIEVHFNSTLYTPDEMRTRLEEFETFLLAITGEFSGLPVASAPIMTTAHRELLDQFNETESHFGNFAGLPELVLRHATNDPEKVAFIFRDVELTYGELQEKSSAVARTLVAGGVGRGDLVAVALPRSLEMVITLLGVFKAGAGYLPVDSELPARRVAHIVTNAAVKVVVSSASVEHCTALSPVQPLLVEQIPEVEAADFECVECQPGQIAYVIYTSGSTGEPKGVEVSQGALWNLLNSLIARPGFSVSDRFIGLTTLSFDIAVLEIWLPLFLGASSVIVDKRDSQDGRAISRIVDEKGVTVVQATPSSWNLMLASNWQGNKRIKAIAGGEPLRPELVEQLLPIVGELWNGYGPTEATVYTMFKKIEGDESRISVGTPTANTQIHIIGETGSVLPPGTVGEICISGNCLALGYRNQPELTSDKFRYHENLEAIAYHTGDLGYFDAKSGEIYCCGRMDDQVKLRGYRIELGEISSIFARVFSVDQAITVVASDHGNDILALAYRKIDGQEIDERLAREELRALLPDYMVPVQYLGVDEFAVTPNGKVDKAAILSMLSQSKSSNEATSAVRAADENRSEMQELVIGVMKQTLRAANLSLQDNFFDIGGHSLLAMNTVIQLGDLLDIEIDLSLIFDYPVIGDFSNHVEALLIEDVSV